MLLAARTRMIGKRKSSVSFSTQYTTQGEQTVSIPLGATTVTIECIGSGGGGAYDSDTSNNWGGGGGAYSKTNTYSVAGLTGVCIFVGYATGAAGHWNSFANANNNVGALLCFAEGGLGDYGVIGGRAASGTGDVKYSGGNGASGNGVDVAGGGAAGSNGDGGNASGNTPGTGNGSPAGNGGTGDTVGQNYGGGGGANDTGPGRGGAQGWVRLTWN